MSTVSRPDKRQAYTPLTHTEGGYGMKPINKLIAMALAACMPLSLTACAGNSNTSEGTNGNDTPKALEVRIWDGAQLEGLQTIADGWTQQTGIAVNIQTMNWDEYWTLLEAGASGGKIYGYAADVGNNQDGWWNIIYDFGGYIINDDKTKSGMDDPKTLETMEFLGKVIQDTMPAQSVISETGCGTLFTSGVVAMSTQGSWNINTFYSSENNADYGWALLPYQDVNGNGQVDDGERCSIYNGVGWAASADTDYPDEAWSLIEWLCNYDNQVKQAELGVTMAGYKGASDNCWSLCCSLPHYRSRRNDGFIIVKEVLS